MILKVIFRLSCFEMKNLLINNLKTGVKSKTLINTCSNFFLTILLKVKNMVASSEEMIDAGDEEP